MIAHELMTLANAKDNTVFKHLYAKGYPNGLYGSQAYHQQINGLDRKSIEEVVNGI
jgi:hypothetical protein